MLDPRNDKKYFGWSSQYDEDVNATNPRLQKYHKKIIIIDLTDTPRSSVSMLV